VKEAVKGLGESTTHTPPLFYKTCRLIYPVDDKMRAFLYSAPTFSMGQPPAYTLRLSSSLNALPRLRAIAPSRAYGRVEGWEAGIRAGKWRRKYHTQFTFTCRAAHAATMLLPHRTHTATHTHYFLARPLRRARGRSGQLGGGRRWQPARTATI